MCACDFAFPTSKCDTRILKSKKSHELFPLLGKSKDGKRGRSLPSTLERLSASQRGLRS